MDAMNLAMARFLWLIYRFYGLACLLLGLYFSSITLQLDRNHVPESEQLPYFAICLALFAGTLFLLPNTTPLWVKDIHNTVTSTAAIASLVGLAVALIAGAQSILPIMAPEAGPHLAVKISGLVSLFTAAGTLAAGWLGLFNVQEKRRRRVPLLEDTVAIREEARLLRKSRA